MEQNSSVNLAPLMKIITVMISLPCDGVWDAMSQTKYPTKMDMICLIPEGSGPWVVGIATNAVWKMLKKALLI
jgi:hypothetical protein